MEDEVEEEVCEICGHDYAVKYGLCAKCYDYIRSEDGNDRDDRDDEDRRS